MVDDNIADDIVNGGKDDIDQDVGRRCTANITVGARVVVPGSREISGFAGLCVGCYMYYNNACTTTGYIFIKYSQ